MRQTSFADMHCSRAHALEMVGDWWTPLIMRDIFLGLNRFDDLVVDLGISRNLLTARLHALVDNSIIQRERYSVGDQGLALARATANGFKLDFYRAISRAFARGCPLIEHGAGSRSASLPPFQVASTPPGPFSTALLFVATLKKQACKQSA